MSKPARHLSDSAVIWILFAMVLILFGLVIPMAANLIPGLPQ